mmetsp:Transcript_78648/g.227315  ORF Transcript_78648/g.227315 Transcript_78648/m.227315 type:complete len:366 (-) Transcript_78648:193-1290(-)
MRAAVHPQLHGAAKAVEGDDAVREAGQQGAGADRRQLPVEVDDVVGRRVAVGSARELAGDAKDTSHSAQCRHQHQRPHGRNAVDHDHPISVPNAVRRPQAGEALGRLRRIGPPALCDCVQVDAQDEHDGIEDAERRELADQAAEFFNHLARRKHGIQHLWAPAHEHDHGAQADQGAHTPGRDEVRQACRVEVLEGHPGGDLQRLLHEEEADRAQESARHRGREAQHQTADTQLAEQQRANAGQHRANHDEGQDRRRDALRVVGELGRGLRRHGSVQDGADLLRSVRVVLQPPEDAVEGRAGDRGPPHHADAEREHRRHRRIRCRGEHQRRAHDGAQRLTDANDPPGEDVGDDAHPVDLARVRVQR